MKRTIKLWCMVSLLMLAILVGCSPKAAVVSPPDEIMPPVPAEPIAVPDESQTPPELTETTAPTQPENIVVEITASGFTPRSVTVPAGSSVTFVNTDLAPHWPASGPHPIHTGYPASTIRKCNTGEESAIFDACESLLKDDRYTFTFTEKGSWKYHDHLDPSLTGTVVVE